MAAIDVPGNPTNAAADSAAGLRSDVYNKPAEGSSTTTPEVAKPVVTAAAANQVDSVAGPLILTDGDKTVAASETTLEARVEQWKKVLDNLDPKNPQRLVVPNDKAAAEAFFALMQEKFGSYDLIKPDAKPGEKAYKEAILVPVDKEVKVASQETKMYLEADLVVNGQTIPKGTELPTGTVYDGKSISTADPRVNGFKVGDVFVPNGTPVAESGIRGGQEAKPPSPGFAGDHIVVQDSAKAGVLDSWPIGPETYKNNWAKTDKEGWFAARPNKTPSAVIPPGLEVFTERGNTTAKPGDVIRADGYSVTPESQANSWLGYTNEAAHDYIKTVIATEILKANAMGDKETAQKYTDNLLAKEQQRAKALGMPEPTSLGALDFNNPYSMAQDKAFVLAALNVDPAKGKESLLEYLKKNGVDKEAIDRVAKMDSEGFKAKYMEYRQAFEASGKGGGKGSAAGGAIMFIDGLLAFLAV